MSNKGTVSGYVTFKKIIFCIFKQIKDIKGHLKLPNFINKMNEAVVEIPVKSSLGFQLVQNQAGGGRTI